MRFTARLLVVLAAGLVLGGCRSPPPPRKEVAAEKPRWYYLTIEAADVDWTVSFDERIADTAPAEGSP